MVHRIQITAIYSITIWFNIKSKKFLFSHYNSMNEFKLKFNNSVFSTAQNTGIPKALWRRLLDSFPKQHFSPNIGPVPLRPHVSRYPPPGHSTGYNWHVRHSPRRCWLLNSPVLFCVHFVGVFFSHFWLHARRCEALARVNFFLGAWSPHLLKFVSLVALSIATVAFPVRQTRGAA